MKSSVWLSSVLFACAATAAAEEADGIGYASVAAALEALRADDGAQFESQQGWTIVANRLGDRPVQWFFTPAGHPAHPSVIKRTALERDGESFIEVTALCHVGQAECDRLLGDFRQTVLEAERPVLAEEVMLDVGIAINAHERVRVQRMATEEGKAAEIRMDEVLKIVIVPTLDEQRRVLFWAAVYEHDGRDFVLASPPALTSASQGTAELRIAAASGDTFDFAITPLLAGSPPER